MTSIFARKKIVFVIILVFYLLGILSHKFQLPPYAQFKFFLNLIHEKFSYDKNLQSQYNIKKNNFYSVFKRLPDITIAKYSPGMNIWNDRGYYNHINDNKINNLFIIKQNRHNHNDIVISSMEDFEILRVSCSLNNNENYKSWKKLDFDMRIIGESCIHDQVFLKKYKAGKVIIFSGGPISSDPIFINSYVNEIELTR